MKRIGYSGDSALQRAPQIKNFREFLNLIREDWKTNLTCFRPGFQAMFAYRFGVWRHGIRWTMFRIPVSILARIMLSFVRNFYGIEIYDTSTIGRRLKIAHQSGIVLHRFVVIGDDCLIRQGVTIGSATEHHETPILGNRVKVGAGAIIAGGITIGDDVVIAPNAVVMNDVPSGSIVASPPARILPRPWTAPVPKEASS